MSEAKPTPGSWTIEKFIDHDHAFIFDANGDFVCNVALDKESNANAAFIVRARNVHYELVEALSSAQYYIGQLEKVLRGKSVRDLAEAESHFISANGKVRDALTEAVGDLDISGVV